MSIIDHTMIKYIVVRTYLDLLPLNLIYFVLENGNNVLENNISLAVGTMRGQTPPNSSCRSLLCLCCVPQRSCNIGTI